MLLPVLSYPAFKNRFETKFKKSKYYNCGRKNISLKITVNRKNNKIKLS